VYINICTERIWHNESSHKKFQGGCIDTGAQKCVIGKLQAKAYCKFAKITYQVIPSETTFRFGDGDFSSLGKLPIRIPIPNNSYIPYEFDVVQPDVPMLMGLDLLDAMKCYANNVENKFVSPFENWTLPITRKFGHLYLCWSTAEICFTKSELLKMHRHFYHPSTDKVMALLKRGYPDQADSGTRKLLMEIAAACQTCQRFSRPPERFKVSIPEADIQFNQEVAIDLMYLNKHAVLHVVDTQTHFMSADFLRGGTVEDVWDSFITCWVTLYTGFPMKIRSDAGSCFTSVRWIRRCDAVGTEMVFSGIESHNSLGPGERYHEPLRRVFRKILDEYPKMHQDMVLRLALKACNDTLGPEGLVPSLLVFGTVRGCLQSNRMYRYNVSV